MPRLKQRRVWRRNVPVPSGRRRLYDNSHRRDRMNWRTQKLQNDSPDGQDAHDDTPKPAEGAHHRLPWMADGRRLLGRAAL